MFRWLVLAILAPALAHAEDRCAQGERLLHRGDLPRAALYLDGCDGGASREVKKQLEASDLSKLEIVTTPAGLTVEIDALPGEALTTPASVWVRAGHHVVKGEQVTGAIDVKPRTHATLVLDAAKPATAPANGHVSFEEENAGEVAEVGKLPDVKHRPMLGCKYTGSCPASGEPIDDPLADGEDAPPPHPSTMLELRGGTSYEDGLAPIFALVATRVAPWQSESEAHPFLVSARADWTRRERNAFGGTLALGKVIAAPATAWIAAYAGAKYSTEGGMEGVAQLDLALRRLPIAVGTRWEQGAQEHELIVELGVGLRFFD